MEYKWDQEKNRANVERRQLDFSAVEDFDWDNDLIRRSDCVNEPRWLAIGYIADKLHVVVFTERNGRCRVISLRIAGNRERRVYAQA